MDKNWWLDMGVASMLDKFKKTPPIAVPEESKAESAPREWYTVFKLGGIRYVPHYYNTHFYVGPGFPRKNQDFYTAAQLTALGAVMSQSYLFTRSNTKAANELVGNAKKVVRNR